jgi:hypothetical protein
VKLRRIAAVAAVHAGVLLGDVDAGFPVARGRAHVRRAA